MKVMRRSRGMDGLFWRVGLASGGCDDNLEGFFVDGFRIFFKLIYVKSDVLFHSLQRLPYDKEGVSVFAFVVNIV